MSRQIRATLFMTLDGVVESPEKWSFPYWNDEIASLKNDELKKTDALLLGRTTYEGFAAAWPGRKDAEGFADKFNSMPKYVVTKSLKKADWTNSHIINKNIAEELAKLKDQSGGDIMVHGSGTLVQWLIKNDLLDGMRLLVYPVLRGQGKKLFTDVPETGLRLDHARTFKTGVVELAYERAATPKPAVPPGAPQPRPTRQPTNGDDKGMAKRLRYTR